MFEEGGGVVILKECTVQIQFHLRRMVVLLTKRSTPVFLEISKDVRVEANLCTTLTRILQVRTDGLACISWDSG